MIFKKISKVKELSGNNYAVLGLPLKMTVSIVIGAAALSFILMFILNPCLFPSKMIVDIEPMLNIIPSGHDEYEFLINIKVTDQQGYAIKGANVLIKGLGDANSDITNSSGEVSLIIKPELERGVNEGYLDIMVKAGCKEKFSEDHMIKIIRGN